MNWRVPWFRIYVDDEDVKAVTGVLSRGEYWANGPEIAEFEKKLEQKFNVKHCITFNSGTSALYSILAVAGVQGKEVILPSFTFVATANAVTLAGGLPVFADIERETCGLDVQDVREKITSRTKAVVLVHYAGCPARDTQKIRDLCREKGVLFIEDAAEAMGAKINDKLVGTFGDAGMLSFCQNKIITTGEGGAMLLNDDQLYEKLKFFRAHGRVENKDYFLSVEVASYVIAGHNFRMPSFCAALGLTQLSKMDKLIEQRRAAAKEMDKIVESAGLECLKELNGFKCVYQMYPVFAKDKSMRDNLQIHLSEKGVMTKINFNPIHQMEFYKEANRNKELVLKNTQFVADRVLTLPMSAVMNAEDINYVASCMDEFARKENA